MTPRSHPLHVLPGAPRAHQLCAGVPVAALQHVQVLPRGAVAVAVGGCCGPVPVPVPGRQRGAVRVYGVARLALRLEVNLQLRAGVVLRGQWYNAFWWGVLMGSACVSACKAVQPV